jgi:integrase
MALYRRGDTWWYSFTVDGRRVQKSTEMGDKKEAQRIAKIAYTRYIEGKWGIAEKPSVVPTIGELLDAVERDYETRGILHQKNKSNLKAARAVFPATMKATALTAADVDNYIARRQKEKKGKAPATINRAIGLIAKGYRDSIKRGELQTAPHFRRLSEAGNTRTGFFTATEFEALCSALPADLQDFVRFAYVTAWRKNEISSLRWSDVDGEVIRLRGVNSKNREARSVVIAGELVPLMERRRKDRVVDGALVQYIFHRNGEPIREFRKSWAAACVSVNLGCWISNADAKSKKKRKVYQGRIFHDLRRCGVRNLIRSGTPANIAMAVCGHKTQAMLRRYDICDEVDLRAAMTRVSQYNDLERNRVVPIAQGS